MMFLMDSGQFVDAGFKSDVCQILNVEHFFYGQKNPRWPPENMVLC